MSMWNRMKARLGAFNRDEQGAGMVEYILIVAAIALPLLALLIIFRDDLKEWFEGEFEDVKDASGTSH